MTAAASQRTLPPQVRWEGRRFTSGRRLILADGLYEFTDPGPPAPKRGRKTKLLCTIDADDKAQLALIVAELGRLEAREDEVTGAAGKACSKAKVALERAQQDYVRHRGEP